MGFLIGASSFICIPLYMVYKLVWTPGSLKQVRSSSDNPTAPGWARVGRDPIRGWGTRQVVDAILSIISVN